MKYLSILLTIWLLGIPGVAGETAPQAINAHYSWCNEPKSAAAKLKRFEGFWKERCPAEPDGYDDHPHVTYVRKCAYRLAVLYARAGQTEKSVKMLQWLEKTDEAFPENVQ